MHSHSFQDTELKLYRNINDSPGQVVEGLTIRIPGGVKNKELITQKQKFDVHSHSFQDTELKRHRYVRQILPGTGRGEVDDSKVPQRVRKKELITHKT